MSPFSIKFEDFRFYHINYPYFYNSKDVEDFTWVQCFQNLKILYYRTL